VGYRDFVSGFVFGNPVSWGKKILLVDRDNKPIDQRGFIPVDVV
jgi:hypothetical protein